MEIKKSDYDKVICYLSGALLLYTHSPSSAARRRDAAPT